MRNTLYAFGNNDDSKSKLSCEATGLVISMEFEIIQSRSS